MFCPKCGAENQHAEAYCTRCGVWLPNLDALSRHRHRRVRTPEEKMKVMASLSGVNALLALLASIFLYLTFFQLLPATWPIPMAAAFCLVIAVHQTISFVWNMQLRRRLKRGREQEATPLEDETLLDREAARSLLAANASSLVGARGSVTDRTTELLETAGRERKLKDVR